MYKLQFKVTGKNPDYKPSSPGEVREETGTGQVTMEPSVSPSGLNPFYGEYPANCPITFHTAVPEVYDYFDLGTVVEMTLSKVRSKSEPTLLLQEAIEKAKEGSPDDKPAKKK